MYIDTAEKLDSFIDHCKDAQFITIDTEFLREKTYYPKLCLIQIATTELEAIIDPLSGLDISPLASLFANQKITKVFHAGDQDRTILANCLNIQVSPIFDTQRAVMLLGLPQQLSLFGIVKHYCKVSLQKGESFSDWTLRPLTDRQLAYALDDVRYLPKIYACIVEELERAGRLGWMMEDLKQLEASEHNARENTGSWQRLKGISSLSGRQLATAREISGWRERLAQARDLPRKWILSDEYIVELSKKMPRSVEELFELRGIRERVSARNAHELVRAVARARELPDSELPQRESSLPYSVQLTAKVDLLSALVHCRAHKLRIATTFLVNHDELTRLAAGQRKDMAILSGWRKEILGDELVALLEGRIAISISGRDLEIAPRSIS